MPFFGPRKIHDCFTADTVLNEEAIEIRLDCTSISLATTKARREGRIRASRSATGVNIGEGLVDGASMVDRLCSLSIVCDTNKLRHEHNETEPLAELRSGSTLTVSSALESALLAATGLHSWPTHPCKSHLKPCAGSIASRCGRSVSLFSLVANF